jgi:hypothetical protein
MNKMGNMTGIAEFYYKIREGFTMKKYKILSMMVLVTVIVCLVYTSCQTIPDPKIPPEVKQPTPEQAREVYREHELFKVGSIYFGTYFLQGTEPHRYPYQNLSHLFDRSSEEAMQTYRKGSNLALISTIGASVGGACLGYPVGSYLVNREFQTIDYIILGTGVATTTASIIVGRVADKQLSLAVQYYNSDLKLVLGVE